MFTAYIGCEEWQESTTHETFEDAMGRIEEWRKEQFTQGLYTATEAWVEDEKEGHRTEVDIA